MSLLDNFKDLADDFQVSMGDKGTLTLGQLREMEGGLTARDTQLQSLTAERDQYRTDLDKATKSMTDLINHANQQVDQDRTTPDPKEQFLESMRQLVAKDDPSQALFEDKLFGKALTTVEQRAYDRAKKDLEPIATRMNELAELVQNGFTQLTQAQVNQRESTWYGDNRNDIPKIKGNDGKEHRMTLAQIKQYATERNITLPNSRLLDLDRTLDLLTEPARIDARIAEAREQGRREGIEAQRGADGRTVPLFSDRGAGGAAPDYSTAGKSARQILSERIAAGLQDVTQEPGN